MGRFRSSVAVYNQETETIKLKFLDFNDSHTHIREMQNIRDDSPLYKHTSLEYVPYGALDDFSKYILMFDAGRPDWWTDEMTTSATQQFQVNITKMLKRKNCGYPGHLSLCYVTSIPAGMRFNVGKTV